MVLFRPLTVREANALLPLVNEQLGRVHDAIVHARAVQSEAESIEAQHPGSIPGTQVNAPSAELREELTALEETLSEAVQTLARVGVQVQRLEPAVIEVPARRGGRAVRLGWIQGTDEFSVWRDIDNIVRPIDDEHAFGVVEPS